MVIWLFMKHKTQHSVVKVKVDVYVFTRRV